MPNMFNVRVYGLWMHDGNILTVEEPVRGQMIRKFPGGGLEFGEGIIDCLRREFREELSMEISDIHHFYTTEFFVQSMIDPSHQVISIYYAVSGDPALAIFDKEEQLQFKWMPINDLHPDLFALPIDKKVVSLLCEHQ